MHAHARTHLLRPDAGEQLVLPQQQIPLEPPLRRVRRRDGELAAAQVNLVVLPKVHVRRARLGVHRARHPVEAGVAADGAEQPPHLGARLEARGAPQDPLLDASDSHAVQGKEGKAHLCVCVCSCSSHQKHDDFAIRSFLQLLLRCGWLLLLF